MGDFWYLQLNCAYCGKMNPNPEEKINSGDIANTWEDIQGIYYAPSSDVTTFDCWNCGKKNLIVNRFSAEKMEEKDKN